MTTMKTFFTTLLITTLFFVGSVRAADITVTAKSSTANSITVTIKNNGKPGVDATGSYISIFNGKVFAVNQSTAIVDNSSSVGPIPGGESRDATIVGLKPSTNYSAEVQENGGFYNTSLVIGKVTIATKAGAQPCQPPKVVINGACVTPVSTGQGGSTPTSTTPISTGQNGSTPTSGSPSSAGAGQSSGFNLQVRLDNPLKVNTITEAVEFFVNTLIKIALPFIVIFFIWAGFKFVTAQGRPDKIKEAKQMFWYTIIGTLLILGAWTITNAIIGTVNSITK